MLEVEFKNDGIYFCDYPFPPASVFPNGKLSYEQILEIGALASEVRTKEREILFIPAKNREDLQRVAAERSIPVVKRIDVWSLILEPFLDTEFSPEQQERTLSVLEDNGVSRKECQKIRASLRLCMYSYNFLSGLWDWCSLDLSDVLDARMGKLSGWWFRLSPRKYRKFYAEAMEIAFRGKILP